MHLWLLGLHLGLFSLCISAGKMLSYERKCNLSGKNIINLAILQDCAHIFRQNNICQLILFIPLHADNEHLPRYIFLTDWTNSSQVSTSI